MIPGNSGIIVNLSNRKADLDAEMLRTRTIRGDTLEGRSSVYNPALKMPYTSEELLFLVEPGRKETTINGSSNTGEDMAETPTNALISVQGN